VSDVLGILGALMILVGVLATPAGWIWLARLGFRESPLWGLSMTLFPTFAAPCFAIGRWQETRLPLLLHCGGVLFWIVGWALIPWLH